MRMIIIYYDHTKGNNKHKATDRKRQEEAKPINKNQII